MVTPAAGCDRRFALIPGSSLFFRAALFLDGPPKALGVRAARGCAMPWCLHFKISAIIFLAARACTARLTACFACKTEAPCGWCGLQGAWVLAVFAACHRLTRRALFFLASRNASTAVFVPQGVGFARLLRERCPCPRPGGCAADTRRRPFVERYRPRWRCVYPGVPACRSGAGEDSALRSGVLLRWVKYHKCESCCQHACDIFFSQFTVSTNP